ncbi:metal-dependent hydrolase [Candidatus Bathyarchaeota archaeon]|nr:MAG: metal-dependent hydrolase [Candidatus Bathyarchaeota archaeon]
MFLLGHSCWSYLFSRLTGRQVKVNLPAYMALLAGVFPDFDIYFKPLIQHHTYTHSLIILLPICAVLVIRFKGLGLAISAGILSHLVADSIVGTIPPLYPLSDFQLGISLGLPSPADTTFEVGALGIVLVLAYLNGDYKLVTESRRESLYLLIPMVSIVTLTLLFAGDNNVSLAAFAFSRKALTLITLGHAVLIGILGLGVFQGVRAIVDKRKQPGHASSPPSSGPPPPGSLC